MKKLACLVLLTFLVAGCHKMGTQIKGSGNREIQKRQVAAFTSISAEGAFTIEVTCGKDQSLEVEGDDAQSASAAASTLERAFTDAGASLVTLALDLPSETALWELRHAVSPMLSRLLRTSVDGK